MPVSPPSVDLVPRRLAALVAALALVLWVGGCRRQPPPEPVSPGPNLLFVSVDTLRADRLGCYGHRNATSPVIDRLAREGARFDNAYAQRGSTWPSLASLMTSLHPVTHGVRENGMPLGDDPQPIAELLSARGYRCGAVLTNTFEQNWEGFHDLIDAQEKPQDQVAAGRAVDWIEQHAESPFFLWVHYVAPHDPYDPPAEYDRFTDAGYDGRVDGGLVATTRLMLGRLQPTAAERRHLDALYDGEVAFSDAMVQPLLDALEARGRLGDTLVVITSDHGDELLDHHDYLFHHASVYEGVLRIPLVIWQPGAIPAGREIADLVQSIDLAPTLLHLLGVPVPEAYQGRSLVPLLDGEALPARPAYGELRDQMLLVRDDAHKYVFNPTGAQPPRVPPVALEMSGTVDLAARNVVPIGLEELYDVRVDRYETDNLVERDAAALARMRGLADAFRDEHGWRAEGRVDGELDARITPELRARLEAMGYTIGPGGAGSPGQGPP